MRNWCWLPISLAAWCAAAAGAPPGRVELASEIARNGMTIAEVAHLLEHDGRTYRITETTKGRGLLALRGSTRRTSRGLIEPDGLKPLEFTDERTGRHTARANLDWDTKTVTLRYKGDPRTEPLPPRAHDRLAFVFDFAFAATRPREVAFDLFDGRGQSRHVYHLGGRERIKTPLGEFDALRYVRNKGGDERTEIWLAAERSFLPLKIVVVEEDGTRFEQVTTKLNTP